MQSVCLEKLSSRTAARILLLSLSFLLAACGTKTVDDSGHAPDLDVEPGVSGVPFATGTARDTDVIQVAWEGSPHARTYVVDGSGENSTCARCHAPLNWVPSMDDLPESCSTCKFEVSPPPPVIAQSEWEDIECVVCHKVDKGKVEAGYAWLEFAAIEEYTDVSSTTELCDKCHLAGGVEGHFSVVVGGVHQAMDCTNCHDAHATTADCRATGCHEDVVFSGSAIATHDEAHAAVGCEACHDAAGLEVGPLEAGQGWTTFLRASQPGTEERIAFASHDLQSDVNCQRCHFEGNPWGLESTVQESQ
jgi:hypothetical protein